MRSNPLLMKYLMVGIILLFIGVAVTPSINSTVVKASTDNDLVEVTSQACGIQGFGNTTVKLTKQQYQDLEQYLVDFRARLNQTTTREEAIHIFKDAVVELNKYGLLPRGMSVEKAQNFVIPRYVNPKDTRLLERTVHENHLPQNEVDNRLCLVAGNTNNNIIIGPIKSSLFIALLLLIDTIEIIGGLFYSLGLKLLVAIMTVVDDFLVSLWIPVRVIPAEILGLVTFGDQVELWENPPIYSPSKGWIYSAGLKGIQSLNGSFHGTIGEFPIIWDVTYIGLTGFTGIAIRPWGTGKLLFLGSAYRAGLTPNPP
jgi:hypothetical protein